LYQYLPIAHHTLAEDGTIVLVNDAWLTLMAFERTQVVGRRFEEFLTAESASAYRRGFQSAIAAGDVRDVAVTVVRGDHAWVAVSIDGRRGRDEHGAIRVHCAMHDITAAKEAEVRLRRSEERYRTLFDESPVALWEEDFSGIRRHVERLRSLGVSDFREHFASNPDELSDCIEAVRVVDVNRATLALYGAESRLQLLAGLDRVIGHDGHEVFAQAIVALANGERSWRSEGFNYTLNGDPIRVSLQWSVAPSSEGEWSRVVVSAIDVTDRVRAESALQESETKFERLFRMAPEVMGISRRSDGQYLDVNAAFLRVLGFERHDVIGRTADALNLWVDAEDRRRVSSAIANGEQILGLEVGIRQKSGRILNGLFSVVPVVIGGEDCLLVQMVDVTALRQAQATGTETQRMLTNMMSNLPGMVYQCCVDPEWTMLFVSEGCRELTGYQPADLRYRGNHQR
jgi:PAS domain S-box-containing protein